MIHHVFANKSNAGDWLSAIGIQQLLAPASIVEHHCDEPFVPETIGALAGLDSSDFIIIGGGGLFMDYFIPFWERFRPLASSVPFCLWGVGFCDTKRTHSRPPEGLLREIIAASRLCFVRDQLSRKHLGEERLPPPVACPTMNAVPTTLRDPLGHVLHVDAFDSVGATAFERMESIGREFAAATGRVYRRTNNLLPAGSRKALSDILELYARAAVVLTSRLHGCIIAATMGRPFVAVSGDRKVESFMDAAGLGEWVLDSERLDDLADRLAKVDRHPPRVDTFVERTRASNRAIAERVKLEVSRSR